MGVDPGTQGQTPTKSSSEFIWPPRATGGAPDDSPESNPTTTQKPTAHRRLAVWQIIRDTTWLMERAWLAPTASPLERRTAETGWKPDPFGAYCDRCGDTAGPFETGEFGCAACAGISVPWDRFVRLGVHSDALRGWIHEVKFQHNASLGVELGRQLGKRLREAGVGSQGAVRVVPTPAHWSRRMTRGVDHAGVIALGVAAELRAPLVHALARRFGRSQRTASATDRARNVRQAFSPNGRCARLEGVTVVLVDDVRTTGATLRACARALGQRPKKAPLAGLWVAVVGVASHPPEGVEEGSAAGLVHERDRVA